MADLVLLAAMFVICAGIGLPLARVLPERYRWRNVIAPTLGYCVLGVVVPVAYMGGLTMVQMFYGASVLAAVGIATSVRRLRFTEDVQALIAGMLATLLLLMLPRWVGGEAFSVFQGNHWDQFGYLESAIVYGRKPFAFVTAATDYQVMRVPALAIAADQLNNRPSVHELYALFSRVQPGQAYRLAYPFLVFSLVQCAHVVAFLIRNVFPAITKTACIAIAVVFPLGFWGQYIFDINAWSQIAAAPILLLMTGMTILVLASTESDLRAAGRVAAVIAISVAGAIYVYPEGFLINIAGIGPVALVMFALRRKLVEMVPFLGFAAVITVVLYPPQLPFLLAQAKSGSAAIQPWWQYFDIFFYGRDGRPSHGFARIADYSAGFFGLYFATPAKGAGIFGLLRRIAILVTIAGTVAAVVRTRMRVVAVWGAMVIAMLLPAGKFLLAGNYWPAGKVVAFVSPLFMTLLCVPAGIEARDRIGRVLRLIAATFLVFQIVVGIARIPAANRRFGIHYATPYPANQVKELKTDVPWNLRPLEAAFDEHTKVLVHPIDQWLSAYVQVFLYSRRIPFAVEGKINTYFGSGRDLPGLAPPWTPDAEITAEGRTIIVTYRDGRAPLRVVSEGDLR